MLNERFTFYVCAAKRTSETYFIRVIMTSQRNEIARLGDKWPRHEELERYCVKRCILLSFLTFCNETLKHFLINGD